MWQRKKFWKRPDLKNHSRQYTSLNTCWFLSAMLVPIRMGTNMASPYKSLLMLWKHFFGYLVYEIFLWPESWWGSLHIYLLSFPRFWTLSIERFWFLFGSFWMAWHRKPAVGKLMEDWRINPRDFWPLGVARSLSVMSVQQVHQS